MPRMSKRRKDEWSVFLDDRNRITYNLLCRKCRLSCKQTYRSSIVNCNNYHSKRARD